MTDPVGLPVERDVRITVPTDAVVVRFAVAIVERFALAMAPVDDPSAVAALDSFARGLVSDVAPVN